MDILVKVKSQLEVLFSWSDEVFLVNVTFIKEVLYTLN